MITRTRKTQQSINILAFDTSTDEASLALWTAGKMHSIPLPPGTGPHSQAACLFPLMQELLRKEGLNFQDLHVIATPTGPGSFTGIRLGLATAQGLALSTKAQYFAPTTFQICAFGAKKEEINSYFVTLTTKRDSFYTQTLDKMFIPIGPALILTEQEVQEFLTPNKNIVRVTHFANLSAENLIFLYLHRLNTNQELHPNVLRPYYVHNPEFIKQKSCSL